MDLLFKRYASPFSLLDIMIQSNKLDEFVITIIDEENEQKLWELYLHHGWLNKSFEDFKKEVLIPKTNASSKTTGKEIEATINHSKEILNSFKPYE